MSSSIPQLTPQGSGGGLVTICADTENNPITTQQLYDAIKDHPGKLLLVGAEASYNSMPMAVSVDYIMDWWESSPSNRLNIYLPYSSSLTMYISSNGSSNISCSNSMSGQILLQL